jgi:hypothetical protein
MTEPDYGKRMARLQEFVKTLSDEALAFPYWADSPMGAYDGTVRNFILADDRQSDLWYPENVWLGERKK